MERKKAQMNDEPLISVIIPCYQQAHYLAEAIESVQNALRARYGPQEATNDSE